MKNVSISILTLIALCLSLVGCKGNDPFKLDTTVLQLKVGNTASIGTIGGGRDVVWTSSDETVATVMAGVVEAVSIGKAVISAQSGKEVCTCEVFVSSASGAGLRLTPPVLVLDPGQSDQFKIGNTFELPLTWTIADPTVAAVSETGEVTALKAGLTKVTLSTDIESVEAYIAVNHTWGDYQLVWSDEFDGTELDRSIWNVETGGAGWGNRELQYYTDRTDNIRVEDGNLVIEARLEDYNNNHYTSGRMQSKGKKEFLYGKFEARIKFPGGKGTWPAWWLMGGKMSWPACGEIDIQEHVGSQDKRVSFALHTPDKNGSKGNNWSKTHFFEYNMSEDYHIYGVEWAQQEQGGKDVIRFFVDGEMYAEVWQTAFDDNNSWPFQKAHYMILNLAIGGTMGGQVDDSIFEQERKMLVDWVRVYQRQEK